MVDLEGLKQALRHLWNGSVSPAHAASPQSTRREQVRLVVGFDFGTSTSKVIVAGKVPRTGQVTRSAVKMDGGSLIPTLASRIDHRISFRPHAHSKPVWRSFKSCLNLRLADSALARFIHQGTGLTAEALCFGYLSFLAGQVKDHIADMWPDSRYEITECVWAMGAPIGFGSWNDESERYLMILRAAVDYPAHLDEDAAIAVRNLKDAFRYALAAPTSAMCHVLPEALVAISAFVLSTNGRIDPGMYCLADVGAGTTDVTWFRHDSRDALQPMRIYSGTSAPVAGDRINTTLAHSDPKAVHPGWMAIPGLAPESLDALLREVAQTRADGMAQIGRKEPVSTFLGAPVNLVLMGGGSNISCVSKALGGRLMSRHEGVFEPRAVFAPTHLKPAQLASGATDLHALALGLSYHPGEHSGFLDRHEIDDWQPQKSDSPEFLDHNLTDD